MPKLTALEVRNYKGPGRLADGEGLSFEITKTGVKRWLYRYRLDGRQQTLIVGRYQTLSLEKARKAHREARGLVQLGTNPSKARRNKKQERIVKERAEKDFRTKTFEYVAVEWIEKQRGGWSNDHANAVFITLKKRFHISIKVF